MHKGKCVQCGKQFTLTDSEVDFYTGNGLSIPKRCSDCRRKNKALKENENEQVGRGKSVSKGGFAAAALALLVLVGCFFARDLILPPKHDVSSDLYSSQSQTETARETNRAVTEKSEPQEEASESEQQTSAVETQTEPPSALQSDEQTQAYKFRNSEYLQSHFEKHGIEMGFSDAQAYEQAAGAVAMSPDALHKTEKEDGDDVYYIEATNEFAVISTDGYIRTYFCPDDGIDYFNRQ